MGMNMEQTLLLLQNLPTEDWDEKDIETLISQAFVWMSLYEGSRYMSRAR